MDYVETGNKVNVRGNVFELWTGNGGADTSYSYQLIIGDKIWMQVGLMISGYTGCYKLPQDWCGDASTNYYRIDGEGNGVNNTSSHTGISFREIGHTKNLPNKLISVGVR